jgi:hypothetical protein
MANNLRPASVINDLRTQAHLALSARLQNLDLTPLLVMMLCANLPASILPYLVWQFDMMIPAAPLEALGVSALTIIQNALALHRKLGTPWALKQALSLAGYPGATLLEGQSAWGGSSYPSSVGWAVFRVVLANGASGGYFAQLLTQPCGVAENFTLPAGPNPADSLRVFYNGVLQNPTGFYAVSGTILTLEFTPIPNSTISAALRTQPVDSTILGYLTQIINFFKPATRYLDSIVSDLPLFFDAPTLTVSSTTVTLPETPATLELYRNGVFQTAGVDYSISGTMVTPFNPPISTDVWVAFGTYGSTTGSAPNFADWVVPSGAVNGTNVTFTLPQSPNPPASLKLYLAGQLLSQGEDYTLSGNTITYFVPPSPVPLPSGVSVHYAFYRY